MNRLLPRILLIVFAILLALYLSLPIILSFTSAPRVIEKQISNSVPYDIAFDKLAFKVIPRLRAKITAIEITQFEQLFEVNGVEHAFKGRIKLKSLNTYIPFFPMLIGKIELRNVAFDNLSIEGEIVTPNGESIPIQVTNLDGRLDSLRLGKRIPLELELSEKRGEKSLQVSGDFLWDTKEAALRDLKIKMNFSEFSLKQLSPFLKISNAPFLLEEGTLDGQADIQFRKNAWTVDLEDLRSNNFTYQVSQDDQVSKSVPFSWALHGKAKIYLEEQVASVDELFFKLEDTGIRLNGKIGFQDLSNYEFTLYSEKTDLSSLPEIFPTLNEWIPLYLGFSGALGYDLVLKANEGTSFIQGDFNLADMTLTIADQFSKSAGYPMTLSIQANSDNWKQYKGDLDISLKDLNFKATLTDLDLTKRLLELNFVTNRFELQNIGELIVPLQERQATGGVKIFGNLSMSLEDMTEATYEGGLVLEDFGLSIQEGLTIQEANTQIQFKSPEITSESVRFKLNDSLVEGSFRLSFEPFFTYDVLFSGDVLDLSALDPVLFGQEFPPFEEPEDEPTQQATEAPSTAPTWSPLFIPQQLLNQQPEPPPGAVDLNRSRAKLSFNEIRLYGDAFRDFECFIVGDQNHDRLEQLRFSIGGGTITMKGNASDIDFLEKSAGKYSADLLIDHLAFEKLGSGFNNIKHYIDGELSGQVILQGDGLDMQNLKQNLAGSGQLFFRNGHLKTLDFLQILSAFKLYLQLQADKQGFTTFDQMSLSFQIGEGKISSDDFKLVSPQYDLSGLGNIDFDGNINYRINVLLGRRLSQKISPFELNDQRVNIPVQIYNTIQDPKFSVQQGVTQELLSNVLQKGLENLFGAVQKPSEQGSVQQGTESSGVSSGPIT